MTDVPGTQDFALSLGSDKQADAETVYRQRLNTWVAKVEAWDVLLREGPVSLSYREALALATIEAAARFEKHKASPLEVPPAAKVAEPQRGMPLSERITLASLTPTDRDAALRELRNMAVGLQSDDVAEAERWQKRLVAGEGLLALFPVSRTTLLLWAEAKQGDVSDEALRLTGIPAVDLTSRHMLNMAGMAVQTKLREALAWALHNLGDPPLVGEAKAAAATLATKSSRSATSTRGKRAVTFAAIVDAQADRRKAGDGAKPMPDKSTRKYKRIAASFSKARGSDDATTVTLQEVEEWRDTMLATKEVGNRSIADRLVSLGTIINWGKHQRQYRDAMALAETPSGRVELPRHVDKPADDTSYTIEEARAVMLASRHSPDARMRWLPWLFVYAGLRISEAGSLRRSDFFQVEGGWFLRVTTAGKRSTKTRSSERRIPVHPALEAEGLVEWVQSRPEGQLFRGATSSLMSRWVRGKSVGIARSELSPNHGLRHLFIALCHRDGLSDSAAEYLAGHSVQKVHSKYGSTDVMLPGLAVEMAKIRPLLPLSERNHHDA